MVYDKNGKWAAHDRHFPLAGTDTSIYVQQSHNTLTTHNYFIRKVSKPLEYLIRILQTIHNGLIFERLTETPPLGLNYILDMY